MIVLLFLLSACDQGGKRIEVRKGGDPAASKARNLALVQQSQISEQIFQIQKAKRYLSLLLNPPKEAIQIQCLRITPLSESLLRLQYDCLFETQSFSSREKIFALLSGDELLDLNEKKLNSDNLKLYLRNLRQPEKNFAEFSVDRKWEVLEEITEGNSQYVRLYHSWTLERSRKNPRFYRNEYAIQQMLVFHMDTQTKRLLSLEHPVRSEAHFNLEIRGNSPQKTYSGVQSMTSTDRLLFKGPCSMPVGDWEFELNIEQTTTKNKGLLRVGEAQIQDRKSGKRWSTFNGCFSNYSRDWIDF